MVPLSQRVCGLVRDYVLHIRPALIKAGEDGGWLIPNRFGRRMNPDSIWAAVRRNARLAGITKRVSTHTLRHTCATHMLRNGAPVRHVQELLGHESLVSTQIYTRVTINDLREIHAKYHPGEAAVAESEEPGPDQVRDRIRITSDRAAEEIFSLTAFFSLSVRRFPPRARG